MISLICVAIFFITLIVLYYFVFTFPPLILAAIALLGFCAMCGVLFFWGKKTKNSLKKTIFASISLNLIILGFIFSSTFIPRIPNPNNIYADKSLTIQALADNQLAVISNGAVDNYSSVEAEIKSEELITLNESIKYQYVKDNQNKLLIQSGDLTYIVDSQGIFLPGDGEEFELSKNTKIYLSEKEVLSLTTKQNLLSDLEKVEYKPNYRDRLEKYGSLNITHQIEKKNQKNETILINFYSKIDSQELASDFIEIVINDEYYVAKTNIDTYFMMEGI